MRIDHVIYGTADLDVAAARVEAELRVLDGEPGVRAIAVAGHELRTR